jgi:hypothetical protein
MFFALNHEITSNLILLAYVEVHVILFTHSTYVQIVNLLNKEKK